MEFDSGASHGEGSARVRSLRPVQLLAVLGSRDTLLGRLCWVQRHAAGWLSWGPEARCWAG